MGIKFLIIGKKMSGKLNLKHFGLFDNSHQEGST